MSLLTVTGLGIDFGGLKAVDAVDLRVGPGEIVSLHFTYASGDTRVINVRMP